MCERPDLYISNYCQRLTENKVRDNNTVIPTPPLSPSLKMETEPIDPLSFMVNPDKVLFQPQRTLSQNPVLSNPEICKGSNFHYSSPFSEDDDLSDELHYNQLKYYEDKFYDEDVKCPNPADWWDDALAAPAYDVQSSVSTNYATSRLPTETDSSRTRLFSGIFDPYSTDSASLFEQIDAIELNFDNIKCRPDTPSESSDAESDDEISRTANNILLEHNYHCPAHKKPPTPKKEIQTGSDDDIDVETYEENILKRVCRLVNLSSPEEIMNLKDFPDVGATVTIQPAKLKRGRQQNVLAVKKVGRPPKNAKRLQSCSSTPKSLVVPKPNCRPVVMDSSKRSLHNSLERMRRVTLKNRFDQVRLRVPSLKDKPKAAKVEILGTAASYIHSLVSKVDSCSSEIEKLTREKELLEQQFYFLSTNCSRP